METGTFTSRDTYAGRVRDIISQNRYTYAENNPVTFADPSGHKITIGTTIGNMFGGGRNTGRNSGIGGIIGNAAQTVVDKVTSTINTVQNTTRNTFNRATGNHTAVITNTTENIVAQAGGAINNVLGGGSSSVNDPGGVTSFVESVAAQIEVARCQGDEKCNNVTQEAILNGRQVYAEPLAGYNWLSVDQQISNAEYIYSHLSEKGWTIEAICGLLGNIMQESCMNPGSSQQTIDESRGVGNGYGLVHWDPPEKKFLEWAGLSKEEANRMAQESPKELMDLQLQYLLETSTENSRCRYIIDRALIKRNLNLMFGKILNVGDNSLS